MGKTNVKNMFAAIRDAIEQRRLRKIMSRYVDVDVIDDLLKNHDVPAGLTTREICFVLIEFNSALYAALERTISSAAEIANAHSGIVDTMVSNLMVVSFGIIDRSPTAAHKVFVDSVLSQFGGQVRLVFSCGLGQVGNIGGPKCMSYSFIHPLFPRALAELCTTPYGEAHEVS